MAPGGASSPSREASGLVAAAVSPLLGAVGLFLWGKVWTGDAYALNLVKCSVGSLGFVLVGALARGGDGWLAALTPDALRWLVASALVGIVVGDNLWLRALRVLGARRVILVDVLKPFVAAALARVELGEGVSPGIVVGMAVTMGGVLAVALERENGDGRRGREKDEGGTGGEAPGAGGEAPGDGGEAGDDAEEGAGGEAGDGGDGGREEVNGGEGASVTNCAGEKAEGLPNSVTVEHLGRSDGRSAASASVLRVGPSPISDASPRGALAGGYAAAAANVALDAWGTVLTKRHGGDLDTWEINFVRFGSAAATLALGAAFARALDRSSDRRDDPGGSRPGSSSAGGSAPFSFAAARFPSPALTRREWAQIVAGVAFTTFAAPAAGNWALFRVSSLAVFSTLTCLGPMWALPLGWAVEGQRVTARAVAGSAAAVAGVAPMFFAEAMGLG